jgi:hypothetical protein
MALCGAAALAAVSGCDLDYPEVVVANRTQNTILVKNASFNGCVWEVVLPNGTTTSPVRCLPGSDHVHFQKYDAAKYCQEQAKDGSLPGVCSCDGGSPTHNDGAAMEGTVNTVPTWFNYQTVTVKNVDYGHFYLFEITLDDMEQDFSVPGPYGHGH